MPNHIANHIEFCCTDEEMETIKTFMKSDNSEFDFNNLLAMPKELDIEVSCCGDIGYEAYKKFLESTDGSEEAKESIIKSLTYKWYESEDVFELGKQYYENEQKYGCRHWYDWCRKNWGTKWNAYDVSWGDETVIFCTAWNGVPQVVGMLAEEFPNVKMIYTYADENFGFNVGEIIFDGGEPVEENYPESESKEAYEMCFSAWGYDDDDVYGMGFEYDEAVGTYVYKEM